MFSKNNIGYLIASGAFFIASIAEFVAKAVVLGFAFAILGVVLLTLALIKRKSD